MIGLRLQGLAVVQDGAVEVPALAEHVPTCLVLLYGALSSFL